MRGKNVITKIQKSGQKRGDFSTYCKMVYMRIER